MGRLARIGLGAKVHQQHGEDAQADEDTRDAHRQV